MTKRQSPSEVSEQDASFGARLRRFRKYAGLSQQELALRAGLSLNAVNGLERGVRKRPYPHTVRSLADALGLSEEERSSLQAAVPARGKAAAKVATPASVLGAFLPSPPTPLVGRERELTEIRELLLGGSAVRLLTLTGIGPLNVATNRARKRSKVLRLATLDFAENFSSAGAILAMVTF
jgi:transcriptional regulator with XRE-family HTH domain